MEGQARRRKEKLDVRGNNSNKEIVGGEASGKNLSRWLLQVLPPLQRGRKFRVFDDVGYSESAKQYHVTSFVEEESTHMTSLSDIQEKGERTCVRQKKAEAGAAMGFSSFFRRAASRAAPLAIRAIQNPRNYSSALFRPLSSGSSSSSLCRDFCRRAVLPSLSFSSHATKPSSDEKLLRVIQSEIQCAEETDDHNRVEGIPDAFPFEIQDNPGAQTISLKREYNGETIKVEVHMPDLVTGEDDDKDNDDDDDKGNQSSLPLVISVSKGEGPALEFNCTAYPDEVVIDSMSVREAEASEDEIAYEGPDFSDLDENLQKAFHKYLEIRGISPSTTNFLHEYMINKDSKEYLKWLDNLKKFVEK
ncbi:hypothetical protein ACLOJK_030112 [Asimina triloba]